ncbi:trifunctional dihydropteroate synthetase [Thecaphora frezii]
MSPGRATLTRCSAPFPVRPLVPVRIPLRVARASPTPLATATPGSTAVPRRFCSSDMSALALRDGASAPNGFPDVIQIKQLTVRMVVGVDNWERVSPQPVTIDAKVHTDVSKAGKSDHLPYSIHYGILVKQLEAHCAAHRYRSLEALAEGLAKICLFVCHAPRVTLNVEKPRSLLHAASAGVQIVRTAQDYEDENGNAIIADIDADRLSALRLSPRSQSALDDKVIVRDLVINAILGVNPWEREDKQDIKLNLVIYSGLERLRQAGQKQSGIADVVQKRHNYRTIVRSITEYVEQSSYKTVESLATSIARVAILHNKVERIRVSVDKPSAIMFAASAGVEVDRNREFFEEEARLEAEAAITLPSSPQPPALPQFQQPKRENLPAGGGEWHIAAIALGSNVGDRAHNLERAVQALSEAEGCVLVDTSFLYETAPMYVTDQPRFLNGACRIATTLSPHKLLELTQSIETKLGRDKTDVPDKGPRSVDLDILLYDALELDDGPKLVIPHPGIKEREFVLEPLKDILPEFEHPKHSRTVAQLLAMLQKSPDYEPSGIQRVIPVPALAPGAETPLWSWGVKTFVMGIINATPDSFSDGGDNLGVQSAVQTALRMVEEGADLLDVGGMSTAPNAVEVSEDEERARVCPVIRAIREAGVKVPISIDTFRASVAEAALQAGANVINDVSGGERDARILDVARQHAVPFILMHMRGDSQTMTKLTHYEGDNVLEGVKEELAQRLDAALRRGVRRWNIILDPGIGFAKDQKGNVDLIRGLRELTTRERSRYASTRATPSRPLSPATAADRHEADHEADYQLATAPNASLANFPVLLGASRKKFLGHITGHADPKQRVYATAAACAAGIASGVDILRVHDVREMVDVSKTCDAIYRS